MLRSYFQLVRIPAVFSSMSNAYAGWWIGGAIAVGLGSQRAPVTSLLLGLIAAGLYLLAGMALNDIADLEVDRKERPERPLPSGAIPLRNAWMLVAGFFILGLLCQSIANPVSAVVGLFLVAAIFLYNFVLKSTFLGPLSMGLCRVLNLAGAMALSFSSFNTFAALPAVVYGVLASLGLYVAIVTYLARDEVAGNSAARVQIFFIGFAAWFSAWAAFAATRHSLISLGVVVILVLHLFLLKDALAGLRRAPSSPGATGRTVGTMLGSMPVTDALALFAAGVAWPWSFAGLLWMLPGKWLARRFYTT
jgi:hypothetical protein